MNKHDSIADSRPSIQDRGAIAPLILSICSIVMACSCWPAGIFASIMAFRLAGKDRLRDPYTGEFTMRPARSQAARTIAIVAIILNSIAAVVAVVYVVLLLANKDVSDWMLASEKKTQYLARMPIGLEVRISPLAVKARRNGLSGFVYEWIYSTEVSSLNGPVQIVEFGSMLLIDGNWMLVNSTGNTDRPTFSGFEFEDWYSCAGAQIEAGKTYTNRETMSGADQLLAGHLKWFFIGVDDQGRHVKGEASLTLLEQVESDGASPIP